MTIDMVFQGPPGIVDEWTLCEKYGAQAKSYLTLHWAFFITQADINKMADNGINHVRIALGWWSIPGMDISGTPYVKGAIDYFDKAVKWCRARGMKIILDVHA